LNTEKLQNVLRSKMLQRAKCVEARIKCSGEYDSANCVETGGYKGVKYV
jgi:hypothetical protein